LNREQFLTTTFLGVAEVTEIVRRKGLLPLLAAMADRIERDFQRWPAFDKSARLASHSPDGVIELMPIADASTFTFKYVNGHPRNPRNGLPTVMAFGVLADVATGAPRLLSELTLTTAMRTAATSAVAARALARPDSRRMALIGNGAQSEFQALAFHHLLGIEEVALFDTDPAATRKLADNLRAATSGRLALRTCASTAEAVRGADIVTTATADKTNATILTPEMIEPGMHVNAVGGDCPGKTELHPGVLETASVFVEYEQQTRIEGDLQQMPTGFPVTELWQVLTGAAPGRAAEREVTVFDSVGFALEDYSALHVMRDAARELGIGEAVSLVPNPADPKDLFGLLSRSVRGLVPSPFGDELAA
jgi:ornithine cyclodeaminase